MEASETCKQIDEPPLVHLLNIKLARHRTAQPIEGHRPQRVLFALAGAAQMAGMYASTVFPQTFGLANF